jgi:hypothetical protein
MTASATMPLAPGEVTRMAKDLPSRPKRERTTPPKKIAATDRVRSKADKADPRFEAARQRVAREEERRARAQAARRARAANPEEAPAEPPADTKPSKPAPAKKKGFSFNQTAQRDES